MRALCFSDPIKTYGCGRLGSGLAPRPRTGPTWAAASGGGRRLNWTATLRLASCGHMKGAAGASPLMGIAFLCLLDRGVLPVGTPTAAPIPAARKTGGVEARGGIDVRLFSHIQTTEAG